jgi:4,5-dihydroxyphthalate decarboxylase
LRRETLSIRVKLAVRDWDYLTPLLLGEIHSPQLKIELMRVNRLVTDWYQHPEYDGGEMSFSCYSQLRARGNCTLIGVPHFLMRGFRHRCIITTKQSRFHTLSDLIGKKIGLTGWQDSGNIWTRAIFRRQGINLNDIHWFVGRLTTQHPVVDRLTGFGIPGMIDNCPDDTPMMTLLAQGKLDAVCTPFMPPGFFAHHSLFRPLIEDYQRAECEYVRQTGYVPGIHILVLKPGVVARHPGIAQQISQCLTASYQLWMDKRTKYAETTPWLLDDISRMHRDLPTGWNDQGITANRLMLEDWCCELKAQQIVQSELSIETLFAKEHW